MMVRRAPSHPSPIGWGRARVGVRDGRVEPREPEAYLKQYVEGASGEPARLHAISRVQACRSRESVLAAEACMNNTG